MFHLFTICSVTFVYFGMKMPQDGADELWRDGFDWIALNVIFKVGKDRFGSFSHTSLILISGIEVLHKCKYGHVIYM